VRDDKKLKDVGRPVDGVKSKGGPKARARWLSNEEEDDGLEKQPSDTIRADDDSPEENLCRRARRNLLPCRGETAQAEVWARTADWRGMRQRLEQGDDTAKLDTMGILFSTALGQGLIVDADETLVEPRCGSCGQQRVAHHQVTVEPALLYHHHASAPALQVRGMLLVVVAASSLRRASVVVVPPFGLLCIARPLTNCDLFWLVRAFEWMCVTQMTVGRWMCNSEDCKRMVEFDGNHVGLFSWRRRNKNKQWLIFTRGLLDKLYSFIISARTTYTAATRHLAADVACFELRRQDVVKLGTVALRTFVIPPESARCPICGPNPRFIVIDAQAIGCTDANDVHAYRPGENCPVLSIDNAKLCILDNAALRAAVEKVLRHAKQLTPTQIRALAEWRQRTSTGRHLTVEGAAATLFFRFFPLGEETPAASSVATGKRRVVEGASGDASGRASPMADNADSDEEMEGEPTGTLEDAVREDEEGNLVLGGPGKKPAKSLETWRDRIGTCAPDFSRYARDNDGVWQAAMPFLRAMLAESATGMFQSHDERAVRLLADSLRFQDPGKWRDVTKAVDGVGFVASFIGMMNEEMEAEEPFRLAVGMLLRRAVDVEKQVDDDFASEASSLKVLQKDWKNAKYCQLWGGKPSPAQFAAWKKSNPEYNKADIDDPHVSYEFFPSLPRVRPALKDSVAAGRRAKYRGKKRHAADIEGDGDACNKAFSITAGLTQGVFNVVCPHVITLGFRVLFRAESVGEALSIVLERFPSLPAVIFYDVACKIDKNAMRRVRPIMRNHGTRCILDRPHAITHTCSPIYMPDQSLGATAGVATQAAEVSHSVSVGNRTSLAYMAPATYITHRIVQVAFMNIRKLYRMHADNPSGENDHIPLAPFFHQHVSSRCQRGSSCACEPSMAAAHKTAMDVKVAKKQEAITLEVGDHQTTATSRARGAPPDGARAAAHPAEEVDVAAADSHILHSSGAEATTSVPPSSPTTTAVLSSDSDDDDGDDLKVVADVAALLSADKARTLLTMEHIAFIDSLSAAERAGAGRVRPHNKANISLTVADYRALRDDQWLNDSVMNSYIGLLNDRDDQLRESHAAASTAAGSRTYPPYAGTRVMNTFFFDRLWSPQHGYDYAGVARWALKAGLDFKTLGQVLIPINLGRVHWVLIVVDLQLREFMYCDPYGAADGSGYVAHVRRWLRDEALQQLGPDVSADLAIDEWEEVASHGLPQQVDSSSCGVFTLLAASFLAVRATCTYTQDDVPDLRRRLAIDLYLDEIVWTAVDVVPV